MLIPAGMGLAAEAWGIEASFYIVGGVLVLVAAAIAFATRGLLTEGAGSGNAVGIERLR
jgi:hypothetical protein